ncbi:hypothetical protein K402DRAFT_417451 [Aulographum hederae CBS 113979]|uniref:DNA-directed RNA polymerase III subunit RPC3 n=1 Tax=Aulographum hederae CBS 113979 TaxID=1176131 RepID=A0A6G1HCA7_9PEZI|nr:hypothetical protein K402DRAFT_417451 [Aulographum hederae CBS 113979]
MATKANTNPSKVSYPFSKSTEARNHLASAAVRGAYGDVAHRVWIILLKGRNVTLPKIMAEAKHYGLSTTQVYTGLIWLEHAQLATESAAPATKESKIGIMVKAADAGVVYYAPHVDNAMLLYRNGKIASMAEHRFGAEGGAIMSLLLSLHEAEVVHLVSKLSCTEDLGHGSSAQDVVRAIELAYSRREPIADAEKRREQFDDAAKQLRHAGFIVPVERAMGMNGGGPIAGGGHALQDGRFPYKSGGSSRANNVDLQVVRVNYRQTSVALRTHRLVAFASKHCHVTTAGVYDAVLRAMEPKIFARDRTITSDGKPSAQTSPIIAVTLLEVIPLLHPSVDVKSGIYLEGELNVGMRTAVVPNHSHDFDPSKPEYAGYMALVERHIEALCTHGHRFVDRAKSVKYGEKQWTVDFTRMQKVLFDEELSSTCRAKFGSFTTRVFRTVMKAGRLEDKTIVSKCLKKPKEVREALNRLERAEFLTYLELPKDKSGLSSKTIYLWTCNRHNLANALLEEAYTTMSKLVSKSEFEKISVRPVTEKANRPDVVGNEEKYLTNVEKEVLRKHSRAQQMIAMAINRCDDMVFTLRDMMVADPEKSTFHSACDSALPGTDSVFIKTEDEST